MKIYIGHSSEFNYQDEIYDPIRGSIFNSLHEIILPHEIYKEAKDFITKDIIKSCDLMIAEVSLPSTGLGIELGGLILLVVQLFASIAKDQKYPVH